MLREGMRILGLQVGRSAGQGGAGRRRARGRLRVFWHAGPAGPRTLPPPQRVRHAASWLPRCFPQLKTRAGPALLRAPQDAAYWLSWFLTHFAGMAASGALCALIALYPFQHSRQARAGGVGGRRGRAPPGSGAGAAPRVLGRPAGSRRSPGSPETGPLSHPAPPPCTPSCARLPPDALKLGLAASDPASRPQPRAGAAPSPRSRSSGWQPPTHAPFRLPTHQRVPPASPRSFLLMLAFFWLVAATLLLFAYCLSTLFRRVPPWADLQWPALEPGACSRAPCSRGRPAGSR